MAMLAIIYRPLVLECFDPSSCARSAALSSPTHFLLPRARGDEPGRRLSGARHVDGGRHHASAGDHRTLLGARRFEHDYRRGCGGLCGKLHRAAALLLLEPAHGPRHHPHEWCRSISSPCSSACRAACCGSSCRANISKLDSKGRSSRHDPTAVFRCRGSLCRNALRLGRSRKPPTPMKVSASFSILGDMVKQVGGDRVEVFTFVGPNGDAHVYEPTPADAKELSRVENPVHQRPRSRGLDDAARKVVGLQGQPW